MPEETRFSEDFDGLSTPRPGPNAQSRPGRWCLLRHDLPDGSWHLDLMIERTGPETRVDPARPLFTLRLPPHTSPLPNHPDCQGFEAERIRDHRGVYLDYEGPVSGGRGSVSRLASGTSGAVEAHPAGVGGGPGRIEIAVDGLRFRSVGEARQRLIRFERVP